MSTPHFSEIPVYCSTGFEWKDKQGTTKGSDLVKLYNDYQSGDLRGLLIKSIKTGKVKYFEPVHDEDGYDGEFMIYRCNDIFVTIWNY